MSESRYEVYFDNTKVADNLSLEIAMILAKALFNEYYMEAGLEIRIRRKGQEE